MSAGETRLRLHKTKALALLIPLSADPLLYAREGFPALNVPTPQVQIPSFLQSRSFRTPLKSRDSIRTLTNVERGYLRYATERAQDEEAHREQLGRWFGSIRSVQCGGN
ncbi:hypothetical protein Clacol_010361 [Clathrus columnatus]|uniref:Uncharacterized protein n=1 Tax=Clathrus columnatus TaxID=1419009 RepID=A0AAV5AN23_9AGAM|nr:hypothetical protein Clacol_010361 [Clathrus columnatus]